MNILPINSFLPLVLTSFIFLTLFLIVLLFVSFYSFFKNWLVYVRKDQHEDEEKLKAVAYQQAAVIIEEARAKAYDIIKQSNFEAQKIIQETHKFSDNSSNEIDSHFKELLAKQDSALKQASDELLNSYKGIISSQKEQTLSTIKEASQDLKKELTSEIEDFTNNMRNETISAQQLAEQKIQEEYERMKKDLETYKNDEIRRIKENMYDIAFKIVTEIVGRSIDMDIHQELIQQSLQGLLNEKNIHE